MWAEAVGLAAVAVTLLVVVALNRRVDAAANTFDPNLTNFEPIVAWGLAGILGALTVAVLSETIPTFGSAYVADDVVFDYASEPPPESHISKKPAVLMDTCRIDDVSLVFADEAEVGSSFRLDLRHSPPIRPDGRSSHDPECPVVATVVNDNDDTNLTIGASEQRVDLMQSDPQWVVLSSVPGRQSLVLEVAPAGSCATACSGAVSTILAVDISENRGYKRANAAVEELANGAEIAVESERSIEAEVNTELSLVVRLPTDVSIGSIEEVAVSLESDAEELSVSTDSVSLSQDDLGGELRFAAIVTPSSHADFDVPVVLNFEAQHGGEAILSEEWRSIEANVKEETRYRRYVASNLPWLFSGVGPLVLGVIFKVLRPPKGPSVTTTVFPRR